ncbi:MAG: aminoacyl-histidine dipeptidase [Bacteroidota bacterium]|nr:aminoacyl-histidine dipeptidase [Bacteroidota bacterium]
MTKVLGNLKPQEVWSIFEDVCNVPRPSKHEEKIRAFILDFAKTNGIEGFTDKAGNVILRKPATAGNENMKAVVMQSHMDMVPQKNNDTVHDFLTDPIVPRIVDGWVHATGTTLGSDNGIGMCASMAIMASKDIQHGPLECLITFDEETGMTGAFELEGGILKADILINLDSEDHGEIFIGCAGGENTIAKIKYNQVPADKNSTAFNIVVKGLKGGHSGLDINLGRGNSNKIMNRILWNASREFGLSVSKVAGGNLRNAIPRESNALVTVPNDKKDAFLKFATAFTQRIQKELATTDPGLQITVEPTTLPENVMDAVNQKNFLNAVYACPNGVWEMSADMIGLVETSNNVAIIKVENGIAQVETLQRSSVESQKEDIAYAIASAFELAGAEIERTGSYPGWKPNVQSEILETMKTVFKNLYGTEPKLQAVHAGLECGLLGSVYPNWDMISFGPTIRSPHSPDERVDIKSVEAFWNYLVETLKNIPRK